ncbi:YpdA family putative bacillithiol disulfide reductase [Brevibacillus humidisoli]|uniref:YpdA family putative bacillithiol disulfide reductase n=1 Tax=Brevibacillus humidisoli TaxID=2895522 RepID=UPI001E54B5F3|nr:YpdA family putative bacillithiol disulfide reductase [Brevibacillus humidisoli]UFJ42578.1 YpdA family putative bacillithiol disulfide reductase [Brevibacillus humidisoli]
MEQVIIIGAGPCGLSAAVELKKLGIDPLLIDKGPIVNSIYRYPTYMIFHSTPELLEIGDIPFTTANEKPTRIEALQYYRLVATRHDLRINSYQTVKGVERGDGFYQVAAEGRFGETHHYQCQHLIVATGYFDHPNRLGVPGEDLSKVMSFYKEAHPYTGLKVAIVGGNNSAVDAALDLERAGAEVTVIYRSAELSPKVKAWTRPVFESMVEKGRIRMLYSSQVTKIAERMIEIETPNGPLTLENDYVFTLIGYRPDRTLLAAIGVHTDPQTGAPQFDPDTMETNVPQVYIAGVIAAGNEANAIFIENGRHHGRLIAQAIVSQTI